MIYDIRKSVLPFSLFIFLFSVNASPQNLANDSFIRNHQLETDLIVHDIFPEGNEKSSFEKSAEKYELEVQKTPRNAILYNNLGAAYYRLQRFEDAEKSIKKAIEISPQDAMPYYNLSVVYDYLKRRDEAFGAVAKTVALEPKNVLFNTQLCEIEFVTEKFKKAAVCYENLLTFAPKEKMLLTK